MLAVKQCRSKLVPSCSLHRPSSFKAMRVDVATIAECGGPCMSMNLVDRRASSRNIRVETPALRVFYELLTNVFDRHVCQRHGFVLSFEQWCARRQILFSCLDFMTLFST